MTAWEFLRDLHTVCKFQTREGKKVGTASASELKRWIQNKALCIDNRIVTWDEELCFPLSSVTLFTKHNKITIW